MTVSRIDHGVSIQHYHRLVGTGVAAIDSDAFDWLNAKHQHRRWILDKRIYRTNRAINILHSGQELVGHADNFDATEIVAENRAAPIFNLNGNHHKLTQFSTYYSGAGTVPEPTAVAFQMGSNWNNSHIDNVRVNRVYRAISAPTGGFWFSNTLHKMRVSNWSDWAIRIEGSGTGNSFQNVFINTGNNPAGGIYTKDMAEGHMAQVNVELGQFRGPAFELERSSWAIDGLHVEKAGFADGIGIVHVHGQRANVTIHNATFSRLDQAAGATNALFHIGDGVSTSGRILDSRTQLHVTGAVIKDNLTAGVNTVLGSLYEVMGDANGSPDAIFKMQNTMRESGNNMALDAANKKLRTGGPNALAPRAFRQFDDEWFSLQNDPHSTASQVYRYTAGAGGALTPTAV